MKAHVAASLALVVTVACSPGRPRGADGGAGSADGGTVSPRDAAGVPPEVGDALCANGGDDDGDGATDCGDTGCASAPVCAAVPPEAGDALCGNGRDDDGDRATDCADPDCASAPICAPIPPETGSLCTNGLDDDRDGTTDCSDFGCTAVPACAPGNPRPADTPDFIVFSVSGHCTRSCPRAYNHEYLNADETVAAIAEPMAAAGYRVDGFFGTDNLYDEPSGASPPEAYGFLSLVDTLRYVRDEYIGDWDNPTRVIVVAHSHGTVWSHLALHVLEQEGAPIPVDILIDLDGVSIGWEGKPVFPLTFGDGWTGTIEAYNSATGATWPFAISNAADSWRIPGLSSLQDSEDVVPDSVLVNLEVWSDDFTPIRDSERNVRLDGSTAGIFFHYSYVPHEETHGRGSDAVNWAVAQVRTAYGL